MKKDTKIKQLCDAYVAEPYYLTHLSPSTINAFLSNKPAFIGKFLKFPRTDNINFQKGNTVERAVNFYFNDIDSKYPQFAEYSENVHGDRNESTRLAMNIFQQEAKFMDKFQETLNYLPALCLKAIDTYSELNSKPACQVELRGELFGAQIFGIADYIFDKVHDCKVTGKTPNEMSVAHKIAANIYGKLTNKEVVYDYFIPLKSEMRHAPINFQNSPAIDSLTETAIHTILSMNDYLKLDPERIYEYASLFLQDPELGYFESPIEYWIDDDPKPLLERE